jgi:hypothetical protein
MVLAGGRRFLRGGCQAVATFALLRVDRRGRATAIADGDTLAGRALATKRSAPAPATA